jgi:fermentation-respiration switch protein FrsA (DUF1100 family)
MRRRSRWLLLGIIALLLLWTGVPLARAYALLRTQSGGAAPARSADLPVQDASFRAADGVPLDGLFARGATRAPSVVLVAGFKSTRDSMLPYARFLHGAGYNVLLYDGRGLGRSGGRFSAGLREVDDARGAVAYLLERRDLRDHRCALLGVSLGAGVAIVAAARTPAVQATVADSAYVDQGALVARLDTLSLGPLRLPLAPVAPWAVDRLLGAPLAAFSPLHAAGMVAPRALLLIHSRRDSNPTTPLAGALSLYHTARRPVSLWIAPRASAACGSYPLYPLAGALAAQPAEYRRRVLAFLRRYLGPARG